LIALALSATLALAGASASLAADPAKAAAPQPGASAAKASAPAASAKPVDINKASRAELKTLPGIGDAEAAKIVAARPYMTKTDLVTKNVLTLAAYDALRSNIVVVHKGPPPKPKP
jgi:DNA uptake protein ComE-like DNA-binding protein